MSNIRNQQITGQGTLPSSRAGLLTAAWIYCVLLAVMCGFDQEVHAQEVVQGVPGKANQRAVINFKGFAFRAKERGISNAYPLIFQPPPMPAAKEREGDIQPLQWTEPSGEASLPGREQSAEASLSGLGTGVPSPALSVSFPALEDDNTRIPPDTHGAVGPNHVMTTLNTQVRIQDRGGTNISTVALSTFWAALGVSDVFDPKTLYDPYNDRWMTTAMAQRISPGSSVLIGVSQTSDPTGSWFLYRVDADTNNLRWVDYPSIGFNKDWIVVSANMFPIFNFQLVETVNMWAFNKTNLYAGGTGQYTLLQDNSGRGFTMVPAITYDPSHPTMYLVEVDGLITSLNNFTTVNGFLRMSTISGNVGAERLTIGAKFINTSNTWFSVDPFIFGMLPQAGVSNFFNRIDAGDSRIQNVVFRNGTLWTTHTMFLPPLLPPSRTAAQWLQFTPEGEVLQIGRIEDPSGVTNVAYPSIAVNRCDDVMIGFSSFSTNHFASASYAFRSADDPPGTMRDIAVMKAGEAPYFKTFGTAFNRWGDYSATVVDPLNDLDMWTLQEYAATPVAGFDRWGTWWGKLDLLSRTGGGRIELFSSSFTVNEAPPPGFATITVLNLGGLPGTVDYSTADGTAVAGVDYYPNAGTLTFTNGQTSASFSVEIIDNGVVNSNKTVFLSLTNVAGGAVIGCLPNAVLTILDDESRAIRNEAGEFNFSSYINYNIPYEVTENESDADFASFAWFCGVDPAPGRIRSPMGALVTVVRTNGSTGRALVDYTTVDNGFAVPYLDYIPVSGTLAFDDYQMSSSFLVPVLSDAFFFVLDDGDKFLNVELRNPRLDPNEVAAKPTLPQPVLGAGSIAGIWINSVNNGFCTLTVSGNVVTQSCTTSFTFERLHYHTDEYPNRDPRFPGGLSYIDVSVLLTPTFPGGSVRVIIPNGFQLGTPVGWFLTPGSDHMIGAGGDFQVWPNPVLTDLSLSTITNVSDYNTNSFTLAIPQGECRGNFRLWYTNDAEVEFNEDLFIELRRIAGQPPVHPFGNLANVSVLFDDQPAGALDREWNPDNVEGTPDEAFAQAPGADDEVRAVAVQPDGKAIIGGNFRHYNGKDRKKLARINADGSLDMTFNVGDGVNGPNDFVQAVYVYPPTSPHAGKVLIAGGFSSVNGAARNSISRLMPDGQLDFTFNPGNGAQTFDGLPASIYAMVVQADGRIVISGDFQSYNNMNRNGLARVNPDGSLDLSFDPAEGADGPIWALALVPNPAGERILIGGDFIEYRLQPRSRIAQLRPDGSLDLAQNFDVGGGANNAVWGMALQTNGIIVVGEFTRFDARVRQKVARLHLNGGLDLSFDVGAGPNFPVLTALIQPDQKPVIGGIFTSFNGTRRMGMARLQLNGALDTTFMDTAYNQFAGFVNSYHFESPNYLNAIALQPDGNFMVGGWFDQVGGNPSYRMLVRNSHTVFTRADKRIRQNVARILGGITPGPGNASFETDTYTVGENGSFASIRLLRTDGRLGTMVAEATTIDRTAQNNVDYQAANLVSVWPEAFYQTNINVTFPIQAPTNAAPISVARTEPNFLTIPLLDDGNEEGDETLDLSFVRPLGSITLGGEYIPIGAALGRSTSRLTIADNDSSRGVFDFGSVNIVTNEHAALARIEIIRTNGSIGRVTLDWLIETNVAAPRAIPGLDFGTNDFTTASGGTLIFNSGQTRRFLEIPIEDDTAVEFDENIGLILTNATAGAKIVGGRPESTARAVLTIIDNDFSPGRLNFSVDFLAVNENDGEATIQVTRTGGSEHQCSIQFQTLDGTAVAPFDYAPTNGLLFWDQGDTAPKIFKVRLNVDGLVEGDEAIRLRLSNPLVNGLVETNLLGQRATANLIVRDGDAYGLVAFSQPFYQADELGGTINITVVRVGGSSGAGSVQYTTSADNADPGVDYVETSGTLDFLPGELSKSFQIPILDDGDSDGTRTVFIQLFGAVNVSAGNPSLVTLTILDNESLNEPAGTLDAAFRADTQANGPVYAIAPQLANGLPDGRLMVAGDFTDFNEVGRVRMARLMTNGALDTSFDPGAGADGSIRAIAPMNDGRVYVGGFFNQVLNTNRSGIARLRHDGSLDDSFNPGSGGDVAAVYAITLQPDDKVLVGGAFSFFNNLPNRGIVRLHTNGLVDLSFKTGGGANGTVYAVALQSDGKILIGGDFTAVDGAAQSYLARLNRNGTVDNSFSIGMSLNGPVRAILVQPDGKIVIGGSFTSVGDVPRGFIARLEKQGILDNTFLATGAGADNSVYALALQVDGRIIVTGDFTRFNGLGRSRITRLLPNGANDHSINFGTGANSFISALYLQPDRKILVGGGFTTFDDEPRRHIARLHGGSIAGPGAIEFGRGQYVTDENSTNALIVVKRRGGLNGAVGASFTTADITAVAGTDYVATNGVLNFPDGEGASQFSVRILDDAVPNPDALLRLLLSNFTGGAVTGPKPTATLAIRNEEALVGFSSTNFTTSEGVASGLATITLTRTLGTNTPFTVNFEASSGSALAFFDFIPTNGILSFARGETTRSFHVPIINDTNIESRELLNLTLRNPSQKAFLGVSQAVLEVHDNDFAPGQLLLSAASYVVDEAAGFLELTIIRTNGYTGYISTMVNTANGSAQAGLDYVGTNSAFIAFGDGDSERIKIFRIPILADFISESNETFSVWLSNPTGGATYLAPTNAIVTIVNNDRPFGTFVLATGTRTVVEGNVFLPLSVGRINGSLSNVSVNFSTVAGSATANADYRSTNGTLFFASGVTNQIVNVLVLDDTEPEGNETFTFSLATPSPGSALGTPSVSSIQIIDNDSPILLAAGAFLVGETITNGIVDASERVTLRLGIKNVGYVSTSNLVATIALSGGVGSPTPANANYGVLVPNGATNYQNFTLTANVTNNGVLTVTLNLRENARDLGTAVYQFRVGANSYTFVNPAPITINDDSPATPYPSTIQIADILGAISRVTVTLSNISHTFPEDVDVLLVSPAGDTVMVMSDAGGMHALTGATLRFLDTATAVPPDSTQFGSGDYRPVDYDPSVGFSDDSFVSPAPAAPYGTTMSALNGKSPNGVWSLFVYDDAGGDAGTIAGGWSMTISTSELVNSAPAVMSFAGREANGSLKFAIRGQPGQRYTLQSSSNLIQYAPVHTFLMPNSGVYEYQDTAPTQLKFYRTEKTP